MFRSGLEAAAGDEHEANIKALVHQPYPLHNWSIAFDIEVAGQPGTEREEG